MIWKMFFCYYFALYVIYSQEAYYQKQPERKVEVRVGLWLYLTWMCVLQVACLIFFSSTLFTTGFLQTVNT